MFNIIKNVFDIIFIIYEFFIIKYYKLKNHLSNRLTLKKLKSVFKNCNISDEKLIQIKI